jgi:hypothetical protein
MFLCANEIARFLELGELGLGICNPAHTGDCRLYAFGWHDLREGSGESC